MSIPVLCRSCGWKGSCFETLAPESEDLPVLCPSCRAEVEVNPGTTAWAAERFKRALMAFLDVAFFEPIIRPLLAYLRRRRENRNG